MLPIILCEHEAQATQTRAERPAVRDCCHASACGQVKPCSPMGGDEAVTNDSGLQSRVVFRCQTGNAPMRTEQGYNLNRGKASRGLGLSKVGTVMPLNPPHSPEMEIIIKQALETLRERKVTNDVCPRCKAEDWAVDLLAIPADPLTLKMFRYAAHIPGGRSYLEALAISCTNCGYTMFHNLSMLGIATR